MPAVPPNPDHPVLACSRSRAAGPLVGGWLAVVVLALLGMGGALTWAGGTSSAASPRTTTTSGPRSTGPASPSTTTTTTTVPPQVTALGMPTFLPLPAGAAGFSAAAVDCPTLFSCVVAGSLQMPDGSRAAAVSVETGATWATTRVPLPPSSLGIAGGTASELTAVACVTDAICVAIGGFGPAGSTSPTQGLIESGSGANWSASSVPLPAGASTDANAGSTLSAVACPGSGSCVIGGRYIGPADAAFPLLVAGSPGSWSDALVPLPSDAAAPSGGSGAPAGQGAVAGELTGVACASPSGCAAIGNYATSTPGHPTNGLVLWGSGDGWSAQPIPGPSGYGAASLDGIACAAPQTCLAVGAASPSVGAAGPAVPLLTEGSGSSWSSVATPLPPGATEQNQVAFDAVACATNSDCSVFGHVGAPAPATPMSYFAFEGSGANLTVGQAKSFLLWPGNPWENVQCPQAAMVCLTAYDGPGSQSVALGWGANWTATRVPVPAGEPANASMHVAAVSCPAPTSCVLLLAGSLGPPSNPGTPNQFTSQNAVVQPVTLPDLSTTTPTTTVPTPTPVAAPTTLPPFPAAPTTTSTAPELQKGALGALSDQKQQVRTASIVLAVVAALLLLALIVLWLRLGRAKHPEVVGVDEPDQVIPIGGSAPIGEYIAPATAAIPVPPSAPMVGEPTSIVGPIPVAAVPGETDILSAPPVPAPFFPVPSEGPPAASPSPVVPPPAAWAPAVGRGRHAAREDAAREDAAPEDTAREDAPREDAAPQDAGPRTSGAGAAGSPSAPNGREPGGSEPVSDGPTAAPPSDAAPAVVPRGVPPL